MVTGTPCHIEIWFYPYLHHKYNMCPHHIPYNRGRIDAAILSITSDGNSNILCIIYETIFLYNIFQKMYYSLRISDTQKNNKHEVSVTTSNPEHFQDESKEYIIFNKKHPSKALLVDNLANPVSRHIKKHWTK